MAALNSILGNLSYLSDLPILSGLSANRVAQANLAAQQQLAAQQDLARQQEIQRAQLQGKTDPLSPFYDLASFQNPYVDPTTGGTAADPYTQLLNTINQAQNAVPAPSGVPIAYNPADFTVPDMNAFVKKFYEDPKMAAYYTKLLNEAQGDVNLAKSRLSEDYSKGINYLKQDVGIQQRITQEDLTSALNKLGLTSRQEVEALIGDLNKRGIALTQGQTLTSPLNVAGEGRAGTEMGMLTEDQRLRKEAIDRTAQRSMEQLGLTSVRKAEELATTQTRGTQDQDIALRREQERLQQEREQKALTLGQLEQGTQLTQQQLNLQKAQLEAQNKQYLGGTTAEPVDYTALWQQQHPGEGDRPVGWFG